MRYTLAAGALGILVATVHAIPPFTTEVLVQEGDLFTIDDGFGGTFLAAVTRVDGMVVNDNGDWLVEVDTDYFETDFDSVLIRNGAVELQEGQSLPEPVGATLDSFDALTLNASGESGWNFFLDGTAGSNDDSGIYFGTDLLIQEGDAMGTGVVTPGTPYRGFFETKLNAVNQILLVATASDQLTLPSIETMLVRIDVDAGAGTFTETLIAREIDIPNGQTEAIEDIDNGPHDFAFNDAGQAMYFVNLTGDTATDGALYRDDTLIAQEGDASPVAGRIYENLFGRPGDMNNAGDIVYRAGLDGDSSDDEVILRDDGSVIAREGASPPEIAGGFSLTSFGSGPVLIDDGGNVIWYGDWDDANTDIDTGLFYNDELLLQEGVSTIDGLLVDTIRGISDGFFVSDSGAYLLVEVELAGVGDAAVRFSFDLPSCPCEIDQNDVVNIGDLLGFLALWFPSDIAADFNSDTIVDIQDLLGFLACWFNATSSGSCG